MNEKHILPILQANYPNILIHYKCGNHYADAVFLDNEDVIAFEIKGSRDSSKRLNQQLEDYTKYCNYVIIITVLEILPEIENSVDLNIGIIVISEEGKFILYREPKNQSKKPLKIMKKAYSEYLENEKLRDLYKKDVKFAIERRAENGNNPNSDSDSVSISQFDRTD